MIAEEGPMPDYKADPRELSGEEALAVAWHDGYHVGLQDGDNGQYFPPEIRDEIGGNPYDEAWPGSTYETDDDEE